MAAAEKQIYGGVNVPTFATTKTTSFFTERYHKDFSGTSSVNVIPFSVYSRQPPATLDISHLMPFFSDLVHHLLTLEHFLPAAPSQHPSRNFLEDKICY